MRLGDFIDRLPLRQQNLIVIGLRKPLIAPASEQALFVVQSGGEVRLIVPGTHSLMLSSFSSPIIRNESAWESENHEIEDDALLDGLAELIAPHDVGHDEICILVRRPSQDAVIRWLSVK